MIWYVLVFFVILKLPTAWIAWVIWRAVRATPEHGMGGGGGGGGLGPPLSPIFPGSPDGRRRFRRDRLPHRVGPHGGPRRRPPSTVYQRLPRPERRS